MLKFVRLPLVLLAVLLMGGLALAAGPKHKTMHKPVHHMHHHRMRHHWASHRMHHHHRMHHWRHHLHRGHLLWNHKHGIKAKPAELTLYDHHIPVLFKLRDNHWRTVVVGPPIATPDEAAYVSEHKDDLNQFPVGKCMAADLLRFTKDSPVFSNCEPWTQGLSGDTRPGWSREDVLKEGRFEQQMTHMLLRSRQAETDYHTIEG